jgi:predicted nucleic acid-binding protein
MSRIFFDAMLFVYGLEGHSEFAPHVRRTLKRCYQRGDVLLTSCLAVGEVMAGKKDAAESHLVRVAIDQMGFELVPFDSGCLSNFARLRHEGRLKAPDAMHLACAAAARTDMFLTGDRELLKRRLYVPGIQFITDFTLPVL